MRAQTRSVVAATLAALLLLAVTQSSLHAQNVPPPRDATPFAETQTFQPPVTPLNPGPAPPSGVPAAPLEIAPTTPAPSGAYSAPTFGVGPAPGCSSCQTPAYGIAPVPAPSFCPPPASGCGCPVQFIAGIEATMFYATVHRMNADTSIANQPVDPTSSINTSEDRGLDRFTYSPRIFLGVQEDGWALIGRFWYLSDSTNSLTTGSNTNVSITDDQLKAYTADLEVQREFWWGGSKVGVFLGARYGSFSAGQSIDSVSINATGPGAPTSTANALSNFSFNGIGLTTGFQGRTPLFQGSSLSLLWGARASVLWGEDERRVAADASTGADSVAVTDNEGAIETNRALAYILEGQLGLEWRRELRFVPMAAYLHVAFEYQYWSLGKDSLSTTASTANLLAPPPAPSLAIASIGRVDADLLGLVIGAGLNW